MRALLFAALLVFIQLVPAMAVNPDEVLDDPALEERARDISAELRCMVCQNQSIDDSNAELARDLRLLVRTRLQAGDSDQEVLDYIVSRYGEFVLLNPRFSPHTWALWGAPVILIIIAVLAFWRLSARQKAAERPLTATEEERLSKLLSSQDGDH